jgi:hypothetical protein
VVIARPIGEVFDFISNHENYGRWFPDVLSITSVDGLAHGVVGKVCQERIRLPNGQPRGIAIEVVESQRPSAFATEGDLAILHPRMEIRLSAVSPFQTRLSLRFYSRNPSVFGRIVVAALIKGTLAKSFGRGLQQLKGLLERPSDPASPSKLARVATAAT